ncbi:MAG: SRPBCC domain-containing protein [Spirochaetota bacterium]
MKDGFGIRVGVSIKAEPAKVWECWTDPAHITQWYFASPDWKAPSATNDLVVGGKFSTRMEARDGSAGFDFWGTYTLIEPEAFLGFTLGDGRRVEVRFSVADGGTRVEEEFEPEGTNTTDLQRAGWQAILDSFRRHVESR